MKIYVASSWRNEFQPEVVKALRDDGHEVYDFKDEDGFHWSEIDPAWQQWTPTAYLSGLDHQCAWRGFQRDMNALRAADACVMVMPCGMSASLETGWAVGAGKHTFVYVPGMREPDLMVKMADMVTNDLAAIRAALMNATPGSGTFQKRVKLWMHECFGEEISNDRVERNHRFIEEALELVQSLGCTRSECRQLVDYVYDRPKGEPRQETGGVLVTLAALCLAQGLDMQDAGETELDRIWTKVEAIRAKQAAKPKHSPLPAMVKHRTNNSVREEGGA